jgi:hypothetical protein
MMTCSGFGTSFFGGCTLVWVVLAILVFLCLIVRRQLTDWTDFPFNIVGGMVGTIIPYVLMVTFTGSYKWGFLIGIAGMFAGGYFGSIFLGESGGDGNYD